MNRAAPQLAASAAIEHEAAAIEREFAGLTDWSDRLRRLIDLGRQHDGLPAAECTEAARVHGCQSQLWLVVEEANGMMSVRSESDAAIMRGVLALLARLYDRRAPRQVADHLRGHGPALSLVETLAPGRTEGARLLMTRLRQAAEAML